ncbi:hypothetical protein T07_6976 [Trichinella nelsoni]|uniref:Uncharacterized protein n=1 Tax=Trichinella nelsoni TaxID=6336 RepID=A0A0V0SAT2_9BILA|nr:hypothetical protein T07_6976 [Trichinella nelsoni]
MYCNRQLDANVTMSHCLIVLEFHLIFEICFQIFNLLGWRKIESAAKFTCLQPAATTNYLFLTVW